MSGYNPNIVVYYRTESNRLAPAPTISISPEIYYSNDNPIGYTYNITLSGYANALRKELNPGSTDSGLEPVLAHMGDIRQIFDRNGGDLHIGEYIVAKGATIKSINFNPSDNRWLNYAPYTVELEFNEIDFTGCSGNAPIDCADSIFHQVANAKNICDNLVNLQTNKIKEFSDKWTFNTDDRLYHNHGDFLYNNVFEANYTISATGKNYYVNNKLIPAYQQAKLFVQQRLHDQVKSLIQGTIQIEKDNNDSCSATKDITAIHNTSVSGGMIEQFNTLGNSSGGLRNYDVYNETISCDTSESDGSFSLTYKALLKRSLSTAPPNANAAIHTVTKDVSTDNLSTASISIKGNIQGLVRGGFIYYDFNDFELPASGSFITAKDGAETKYDNAKSHYFTFVGDNNDLKEDIKEDLNIKKSQLLIPGTDGYPSPTSFVLDHNYHDGTIGYTATYDRGQTIAKDRGYLNISIVRNDPVDMIQEFVVPGRAKGPIIQKLNMQTARTISINIDGANRDNQGCIGQINDLCSYLPKFNIDGFDDLLAEREDIIRTREEYTSNPIDGSFSISLEYTAKESE